jgi:hypothetical protein
MMPDFFQHMGRFLIVTGIVIAAIGALMLLFRNLPFPGKLPGDIVIQKKNFTFYFPVGTSILLSILLSLILYFLGRRP